MHRCLYSKRALTSGLISDARGIAKIEDIASAYKRYVG